MRKDLVGITLILLVILGIFSIIRPPNVSAEKDPQLAYNNNILYLHYNENNKEENRFWMNASSSSETKSFHEEVGFEAKEYDLNFSLKPKLEKEIYPNLDVENNVIVTLHIETETLQQYPLYNVWIKWHYGDSTVHSDAPENVKPGIINFEFSIGLDAIKPGTEIFLQVHFGVRAKTTVDFHTDDTSITKLELLEFINETPLYREDMIVESPEPDAEVKPNTEITVSGTSTGLDEDTEVVVILDKLTSSTVIKSDGTWSTKITTPGVEGFYILEAEARAPGKAISRSITIQVKKDVIVDDVDGDKIKNDNDTASKKEKKEETKCIVFYIPVVILSSVAVVNLLWMKKRRKNYR
jgi:hypothetical protein